MILERASLQPGLIPNTLDFVGSVCRNEKQTLHGHGIAILSNLMSQVIALPNSTLLSNLKHTVQLFRRVSQESSIDPTNLLRRLESFLRTTDICKAGDWAVGTALLEACAVLIAVHPTDVLLRPLGAVLHLIHEMYKDLDVSDSGTCKIRLQLMISSTDVISSARERRWREVKNHRIHVADIVQGHRCGVAHAAGTGIPAICAHGNSIAIISLIESRHA
jgi:hypothetical protein